MKRMWSEEEIQSFKKDISNLVDSKGNPRFIEGTGTPGAIEGFTATYCKWSLSGTHLMFVIAGNVTNNITISNGAKLAEFNIPPFIFDKIYPVWGTYYIESKDVKAVSDSWDEQTLSTTFAKYSSTIVITKRGNLTLTSDKGFRIQYDLVIDSE